MWIQRYAAVLLLVAAPVAAQEARPQGYVELGVGLVGLRLPDYRGSDDYNLRGYPFPYLVYRTERVRVSREGVRARVFARADATVTLSFAGSLPGDRNSADREGMPDLLPTFEVGPSLDLGLSGHRGGHFHGQLRLPARAVVATDLRDFETIGWVFHPHLRGDWRMRAGDWGVVSRLIAGPHWATRRYHEYFYEVDPQFAVLPDRPAYRASGGYGGFRAGGSLITHNERVRYGVFASYDWLEGTAFEDSPLLKEEHSLVVGLYVSWRLWSTGGTRVVEADDS